MINDGYIFPSMTYCCDTCGIREEYQQVDRGWVANYWHSWIEQHPEPEHTPFFQAHISAVEGELAKEIFDMMFGEANLPQVDSEITKALLNPHLSFEQATEILIRHAESETNEE